MRREKIIERTIDTFAMVNDVSVKALFTDARRRTLIDCRRMIYAYLRENTAMTLVEIARVFEKNHATSLFHIRRHDELMEKTERGKWLYPKYATTYEEGAAILNRLIKEALNGKKFSKYLLVYRHFDTQEKSEFKITSSTVADAIYQYEAVNNTDNLELISASLI